MRSLRLVLLAFSVVVVVVVGGCGDDADTAPQTEAAPETEGATVAVASTPLGEVLVDGEGRTLYLFTKDEGDTSACTGGCASAWPAVMVDGEPVAGPGVDEGKLGANDAGQVTYGGHPLYRYAQDAKAGDVTGQSVGGVWFAVDAEGEAVEGEAPTSADENPTPSY